VPTYGDNNNGGRGHNNDRICYSSEPWIGQELMSFLFQAE
jgi:hypothetical protein